MSSHDVADADSKVVDKETSSADQVKRDRAKRKRSDCNRLHATRHGMLSKSPLQSLAARGENVRQLRRIERQLSAELRPVGIIGEILFDRLFSSYLRCVLIARTEEASMASGDRSNEAGESLELREAHLPTLVSSTSDLLAAHFSKELVAQLAIVRKYDSHFSREFYRSLGMLLIAKNEGEGGLLRQFAKVLTQNRGSRETSE